MNIEEEKIFTLINCGIKYQLPWKYLKRCEFFELLRQENKIPESDIFELFVPPVSFPYILSYLINPSTVIPIKYKTDFQYFCIEPIFQEDKFNEDKFEESDDDLQKLYNYANLERCTCGSENIKPGSGGYCYGCDEDRLRNKII